jgi:phosphopantothenoylcysteine decarboxylase/phosphopantothenate--cysteine ligase
LKKRFQNNRILLGVTGSIAAYKACEVMRKLQKEGAEVQVVMTSAAQKFIGPLCFETLSNREVITDLFPSRRVIMTRHISMAEWAECILICPATANCVGKIASGIADDFLTTVVMASRSPVVIAPAMDYQMVQNQIYLENCKKLADLGYRFVSSEKGELASGAIGPGRLAGMQSIIEGVKSVLFGSDSLKGIKILVTAGPTREYWDPVRYMTNHSSGKMGFTLAEEAALRGADVTLVSGPTNLQPLNNICYKPVLSAEDMARVVQEEWQYNQVLIMAAAVADYTPAEKLSNKFKKESQEVSLKLTKTEDILKTAALEKKDRIIVGFALETQDEESRAIEKLRDKKCDFICLNNPTENGSGFEEDTNKVTIFDRNENKERLPLMPKWEVAQYILDRVEKTLGK